jgi:hypothetical protein
MNYDRRSVGQSVSVSIPIWGSRPDVNYYLTDCFFFRCRAPPLDERSGLSFVLVTWTASVQFSKSAAGPRQHSVYLSVFITPGEMVAQLHPQALGSSGTLKTEFLQRKYKNPVRTSQETHYVTATKRSWLMLFEEIVAVYCENHTEHTDTLCGKIAEFVPHRKHITSPLQSPAG